MKKILILILVLLLSGCGSKNIKWEDVSSVYDELNTTAAQKVSSYEAYGEDVYKALLNEIKGNLENLSSGIKADGEEAAKTIWLDAEMLKQLAASFNNDASDSLSYLAESLQKLVQGAYGKASDFKDAKQTVSNLLDEALEWGSDMWSLIEKKKTIKWTQVKEGYETLKEETLYNLPRPSEITELELEGYKDTILNNYELIKDGVTEETKINADVIYEAAVSLKEYTEDLSGETAEKVTRFADQAISYVMEAYGEKIEDPDYDFLKIAQDAGKWTLSVWNELVKLINL